jgi:hypothetical protein
MLETLRGLFGREGMDVYSKAIFTIIAVALCAIAVENAGSRARAQVQNDSKIAICSPEGFRCADVVGGSAFGGGRLRVEPQ